MLYALEDTKSCPHEYREHWIGKYKIVTCRICKQIQPKLWKPFKGIPNPEFFFCSGGCGKFLPLAVQISIGYPGAGMQYYLEKKALAICNRCGNYHCDDCASCENHNGE